MPMDTLLAQYPYNDNMWIFFKKARWEYRFCWLPTRCLLTKKQLWLKRAYRGEACYHEIFGSHPICENNWISKEKFVILALEGKIISEIKEG
jgi:hypothetical protein